jgi:hypothetical protein
MLGFNTLLRDEGIDPSGVRLVRHRDTRYDAARTPYKLWQANDGSFELYQRLQIKPVFRDAGKLAMFVVSPLDETVFAGLYDNHGVEPAPAGLRDPLGGHDASGINLYDLRPSSALQDYVGRLLIDWGKGYRVWVQRADNQNKRVVELRRSNEDPPFPGFMDFEARLSDLQSMPSSWRTILASVSGVYLLINLRTGEPYVGSAFGSGGFWSRWESYAASGHGGNVKMRAAQGDDYLVSILEIASSSARHEDLLDLENRWKRKLASREFGLNAN